MGEDVCRPGQGALGGRWVSRYHSHGVSWMPSPQHHLPESSLLAGNLLLPSRDQVVEWNTGDAGSGRRVGENVSGLSWPSKRSYLPWLVTRVWVSQGGVSLPHYRGKARRPQPGARQGESSLVGLTQSPMNRAGESETREPGEFCPQMSLGPSFNSHQTLRRRWKEREQSQQTCLLGLALSLTVCVALG